MVSEMAKSTLLLRLGGLRILSVGPFLPGSMTGGGGLPVLDGARRGVLEVLGLGLGMILSVWVLAEEGGRALVWKLKVVRLACRIDLPSVL